MQHSVEHRQALLSSLMKMNTPEESTPEELVSLISNDWRPNAITFTDEDLPHFGPNHNLALYINVECMGKVVPIVLIGDGSTINVIPLSTALKMNIPEKDMIPCNEGVRAFDGTRKGVKGIISLNIRTGPIERKC